MWQKERPPTSHSATPLTCYKPYAQYTRVCMYSKLPVVGRQSSSRSLMTYEHMKRPAYEAIPKIAINSKWPSEVSATAQVVERATLKHHAISS